MITGHSPFEASDATASLARLLNEPVPRVRQLAPDAPADLADVIEWAMARDPLDRPDTATALEARLAALADADPPEREPLRSPAPQKLDAGESTVVMPRGAVDGAAGEARALRRIRPRVGLAIALSAVAIATTLAATLAAAVRVIRGAASASPVESALVTAAALVIASLASSALSKRARAIWTDPFALRTLTRRITHAQLGAAAAAGAVLLLEAGPAAVTRGGAAAPAWTLLCAGAAAALAALLASRR
jgi:hypothetical protein